MNQTTASAPPAPPPFVPKSLTLTLCYIGTAILISLTQGVAQGFVTTNIAQIAGDLGVTTTQASWMTVAFLAPRASLPVLLIKLRTQYGLRRFAEWAIVGYLIIALAGLAIFDLRSALVLQFFAGVVSAPLSSLAFLYMLEPLPQKWKFRLGLPLVMAVSTSGTSLARIISPTLIGDYGWGMLHLMTLGMAAISLGLVYLLPLTSPPRVKVLSTLDLLTWILIALGFGGITAAFVTGSTYGWTNANWIGLVLVAAIVSLASAAILELNRRSPLLDIRWLFSPAMVHFTITLLVFRLVLSEQSAGAPRMFQVLGVTQNQLVPLFSVIVAATLLGGLVLIPFIKPERIQLFHLIALILITTGAWIDSHATVDTRPEQMMLSQAMIAFAGVLFIAPAMMVGLLSALTRGPNYVLSFIIVFLSTQSLGGAVGSGLFTTFINNREVLHLQVIREELATTDPMVAAEIAARATSLASQIADKAVLKAQAVGLIVQEVTRQAYVMAYNDAYRLTSYIAFAAFCVLVLHVFRDWLARYLFRRADPEPETIS